MPQMAPLWWMTLNIMFITCFIIISTIIYFYSNPTFNKKKKNNKISFMWTW
uniref:ATP synthase F0 subunit 8 n=1 Tax=Macropsis hainanensis TaxID=3035245 RepID=UPI0024115D99|nr:ATP synthase F0 subunit 8 [Macropsis hainanensis]WEP24709.1 ATP synthase F0 subunit 8 [Macropsis hainanensis]